MPPGTPGSWPQGRDVLVREEAVDTDDRDGGTTRRMWGMLLNRTPTIW